MYKPRQVKPLPDYKLWLEYIDGVSGEVDLSHLAGKGVFKYWDDYANFEKVYIAEGGEIAWSDTIDLCPDTLYMRITGKSVDELFSGAKVEYA